MRIIARLLLMSALAASPLTASAQSALPAVGPDNARVIVKLKADSALLGDKTITTKAQLENNASALAKRTGIAMTAGAGVSDRAQVVLATGISSAALATRLAQEPDVEYAVPDQRRRVRTAPNDPLYAAGVPGNGPAVGQWYLRAPSGAVQSSIDIEPAWDVTMGSPSIVVADIDTGVRFEHPDLLAVAAGGNLLPGYDMISDVATANDGDGRDADASDPGDWVTAAEANNPRGPFYQCTDPDPTTGQYVAEDSSWHGTQVAGLIVALTNNGIGMASVGPHLRLLPVRALGKCGGFDSDIIAGMRWAAGLSVAGVPANPTPARVINMSLGADGACTQAYRDAVTAITATGSVIVVAAGNNAGHGVTTPGDCPGVIAVAGLRHVGTKVGFSALGPEVALSSPGGNCVNVTAGSACLYPMLTTSNSGTTVPVSSIYTDSFNVSLGTSFATPLVAGTAGLMLSVQPSLTPHQLKLILEATSRPFPATSSDATPDAPVPQCTAPQTDSAGNPVDQLECICTIDTCGAGMLDAGAAVHAAAVAGVPAATVQGDGLWWKAPAASESGWGINFAHQGNVLFATWFTYDTSGKAWWLSMTANNSAADTNTYTGSLLATHGPAFSAVPFDPNQVTRATVGSATISFDDVNRASFAYTLNGVAQTKAITRQAFATPPTCSYLPAPNFAAATNYQDLWWAAGGAESGWGVNLTHQGNTVFATWFTYDVDGTPLWLSATAAKTASGTYSGQLIRTAGPPFSAVPFNPAAVTRNVVGTATFTFANGNAATFAYSVNGVAQTKQITRQLFAPPAGTLCQ